jgi:hypothetical protein
MEGTINMANDEVIDMQAEREAMRSWSELTQEQKVDLLLEAVGDLEKELKDIKHQLMNHQHLSGYSVVVKE